MTSKLSINIMNKDKNGTIGPIRYIYLPKIHVLYIYTNMHSTVSTIKTIVHVLGHTMMLSNVTRPTISGLR
jgi:hypothetical protein